MKTLTVKMLISLAAVALAAPFFALALVVGARAIALAHSVQDNFLLVALAFVGAGVSVLNGFGQRTTKRAERGVAVESAEADYQAASHSASMMHPGY
jgi:predicted membrane-bound mannosyltransferase